MDNTCSVTDVLVHMLMKGAAKCNNHCELQNSVNQLTIERRCALGAFLRACLCQCFYVRLLIVFDGNMLIVQQSSMIVASNTVTATRMGLASCVAVHDPVCEST